MKILVIALVFLCYRDVASKSLVVSTTEAIPDISNTSYEEANNTNKSVAKPKMYNFHVESDIKFRFAHTLVSTRIANPAEVPQEVSFSAVLPGTAFISGFVMEVDGKVYEAYVKEKEEAKQVYKEAVRHGQTAAHVALTARDSNRFTVSVNLEPHKKVTFNLTYEELLSRKLGTYRNVINLDPGQIVQDFSVVVSIEEKSDITTLKVPALRVSNEIQSDSELDATNPLVAIERPNTQSAIVRFAPNTDQQRELASDGIKGQLIVEYDVDRTSNPGEILVNDGYFVHYFSPSDLTPLNKHVTFVLDLSGSMSGRKIEQLRQAMTKILGDLNKYDMFSIVLFSETAQAWDPSFNETEISEMMRLLSRYNMGSPKATSNAIVKADTENVSKAKEFVSKLEPLDSTNIYDGLMMALEISKLEFENSQTLTPGSNKVNEKQPEPIIIFLTDGQPNVRVSVPDDIVTDVTKLNTKKSSIFSLALGDYADTSFLEKLSLRNFGFARKIYEAADTALQLTDFYREISSPLLSNVSFIYAMDQVDDSTITRHTSQTLFSGSELVVSGKFSGTKDLKAEVQGSSATGKSEFQFIPTIIPYEPLVPSEFTNKHNFSSMERMWAYLTIQQLLEKEKTKVYNEYDAKHISADKQRALDLALKYSFVTPLTSLIVVKPNETKPIDTEDASKTPEEDYGDTGGNRYGVVEPLEVDDTFAALEGEVEFLTESYLESIPESEMTTANAFIPATLVTLNDIIWLAEVTNNYTDNMTLATGVNGTIEVLKMASENEKNMPYSSCTTPTDEPGYCRHLRFCVLDTFTLSKEDFVPYLCHIDNYVGVCCPEYII